MFIDGHERLGVIEDCKHFPKRKSGDCEDLPPKCDPDCKFNIFLTKFSN